MKILLDTNRYADFARGNADVVRNLESAEMIYLPFVVLAELWCGFLAGSRARQNEGTLSQFLSQSKVAILYPDAQTTVEYGRIYARLRQQGTPIPVHDMWIAALCLQHELTLYARDNHFDLLADLKRL